MRADGNRRHRCLGMLMEIFLKEIMPKLKKMNVKHLHYNPRLCQKFQITLK